MDTLIRTVAGYSFLITNLVAIAVFVKLFRLGKATRHLWRTGLILAGTLFTVSSLLVVAIARQAVSPAALGLLAGNAVKVAVLAMVGVFLSRQLGFSCLPLLHSLQHETRRQFALKLRARVLPTILVVLLVSVLTVMVFRAAEPRALVHVGTNVSFLGMLLIAVALPLEEELIFRLGIQTYLTHVFSGRNTAAIVLTSALFSLQHFGVLEPEWVKISQTFVLSIALGWLYRMKGLESAFFAHGAFNGVATTLYVTGILELR